MKWRIESPGGAVSEWRSGEAAYMMFDAAVSTCECYGKASTGLRLIDPDGIVREERG